MTTSKISNSPLVNWIHQSQKELEAKGYLPHEWTIFVNGDIENNLAQNLYIKGVVTPLRRYGDVKQVIKP